MGLPDEVQGLDAYRKIGQRELLLSNLYTQDKETFTVLQLAELINLDCEQTRVLVNRLRRDDFIQEVGKEGKQKKFSITEHGKAIVARWIQAWRARNMPREAVEAADPSASDFSVLLEQARDILEDKRTKAHSASEVRFIRVPWEVVLFHLEFSEKMLDDPDEALKMLQIAYGKMDVPSASDFQQRTPDILLEGFSSANHMRFSLLGHEHLNKLYSFDAVVTRMSEISTKTVSARFECPSCGNIIPVLQLETKFKEPSRCGCGRKGKFKELLPSEKVNSRVLVLEEPTEIVSAQMQPKRIKCNLNGALAHHYFASKFPPGTRVKVLAILRDVRRESRTGGVQVYSDLYLDAVTISPSEDDQADLTITKEDELELRAIAERITKEGDGVLAKSFCPYVSGMDEVKRALLHMAASGKNEVAYGRKLRRSMHVLLVGDPGKAKTELAKGLQGIVPRARFAMGKQSSGAGLIASVEKDTIFGSGWTLEAGQVVLADGSMCVVDELDKMDEEDVNYFLEVMNDQQATISKATIKQTLQANTSILALANPKSDKFDVQGSNIAEQIPIRPTILNRFDLVVPIFDVPNEEEDNLVARAMFRVEYDLAEGREPEVEIPVETLRKYVAFVRQQPTPRMTREVEEEAVAFYVGRRRQFKTTGRVPVNARTLNSMKVLAFAHARLRLSPVVEALDMREAMNLYESLMRRVFTDVYTGQVTSEVFEGVSSAKRKVIDAIPKIVDLHRHFWIGDLIRETRLAGEVVRKVMASLLESGDVMSVNGSEERYQQL